MKQNVNLIPSFHFFFQPWAKLFGSKYPLIDIFMAFIAYRKWLIFIHLRVTVGEHGEGDNEEEKTKVIHYSKL